MDFVDLVSRDTCSAGNEYDGLNWGARISSVFVILATSAFGAFFPVLSSRYSFIRLPNWCFFICKFFGSGVIIATSLIHLLQPADEALSNECLGGVFEVYPIAYAICLITLFVMFFLELIAYRYVETKLLGEHKAAEHTHSHFGNMDTFLKGDHDKEDDLSSELKGNDEEDSHLHAHFHSHTHSHSHSEPLAEDTEAQRNTDVPFGPDHFSHKNHHQDPEVVNTLVQDDTKESYYGQLVNIFVLEFGIIFHSVFVGLSLAVSGEEFVDLYIVVIFHQMFEGLGLGSRIATVAWPKEKRATPWLLATGYALTTPISIAIGLGVRTSYDDGSRTALITNGVFDAFSAGILLYTGLIELMAHEFLFSDEFKGNKGFKKMIYAYFIMMFGAGIMALLGRWA